MATSTSAAAKRAWVQLRDLVLEDDDPRKRVSNALGITYFKVKVLISLLKHSESASDLVQRFASDKTYISLILRDLEVDGSIMRVTSPTDRRSKLIMLTDQGRELAKSARSILDQPPRAFNRLSSDEVNTLLMLIEKIMGK
ncbi:winged helix DNA-binding protein [Burkholderia dolosa]|uniref:Winged helix DNA-binding protein n=1 Tax=Burkholderia dolosa TaxID=152500 RepID=A0A892IDR6_9BURK|nr:MULTISPECIES: winged helix DNA-binding protein [Burkholderia]AKE01958.1 hypothetical protein XM57_02675 [Burkholderia cepacia]AJY11451.1 winged helix DNA-binding domain protein [Burkholderia dolosa AU0158]AYZ95617.1 MarR family transcriptional regulator [Burkholderia dolosa]EAY72008.1 Transcriptional regulator [Burkholderia dolosa AU0158]ETP61757.1 hypothetical protein BDSB_28850 [Burkholderia dolosa PC543]